MNRNGLAAFLIGCGTILLIYFIHLHSVKWPAERTKNDHWAEQAKVAPENFRLICPPSDDGKPIPAEKCKRSGQYQYDRQQQIIDHKAQVSMRNAAWVTTFFTGLGLMLVGITLIQAWKAAGLASKMLTEAEKTTKIARDTHKFSRQSAHEQLKEARRATRAADDATRVTRDMGVAQTRAYISIKKAELWVQVLKPNGLGWHRNNKGNFHFSLMPVFENTGNTPAYNLSYKFKITLLKSNKPLLESGFGDTRSFGVVGHKSDTSTGPVYIVSTDVSSGDIPTRINASGVRCWVTIRAEYSDVFKNRWFVESVFEGNPNRAEGDASNVKELKLRHQTASDKHGKV